ncbi:hypothetical protein PISMIDRAFT_673027 [Pisolithus microcarpus 441]|uniref:Uncharacterized protein n=1 Tax=Pisolithus microcarpus 441 TaxID=765257 RepID=A0A0C9YUU1_9AGAM|nr:hypothetical protein PISMIDRAFT_673027 [Pisolithus microcarpus 441]
MDEFAPIDHPSPEPVDNSRTSGHRNGLSGTGTVTGTKILQFIFVRYTRVLAIWRQRTRAVMVHVPCALVQDSSAVKDPASFRLDG